MIYVFCTRNSDGVRDLVQWFEENGHQARHIREAVTPRPEDLVINWGYESHIIHGDRVLNQRIIGNKFEELRAMAAAGVPVPEHTRTRPGTMAGWLARTDGHQEASDLRQGLLTGDYYTRFVPTTQEYRVHVFGNLSVRMGVKEPRADFQGTRNERFRAWSLGWGINYGFERQGQRVQGIRDVAKRALRALRYNFGAVDVGVRPDGTFVVFEVNSAPGLEGGTIACYGRHFLSALGTTPQPRANEPERMTTRTTTPRAATRPAEPPVGALGAIQRREQEIARIRGLMTEENELRGRLEAIQRELANLGS